ncbi:ATP synthase F1 subunit delta [Eudoraea chungangensis]|uniref:ATP synthase F1 subunit delta n=1 Tax=Eudoraea chungangensis TaxID=1481905 RepID=UPI0023EDC4F4|nr:ATP synthase F1 subunit delta [Eudoraea chungangensis]
MSDSRAALRYAKAIIETAKEQKLTNVVEKDMHLIVDTLSSSDALKDVLASPIIEGEAKIKVLKSIFAEAQTITLELLDLLMQKNRIPMLNEVAKSYIKLNEELKGESVAVITTAVPISSNLEKKVLQTLHKISKEKITLQNVVNPDIIGGFVLRIGDLQYNSSISNKLNNLKREFTNGI